jgi:RHS repeat-associated protein
MQVESCLDPQTGLLYLINQYYDPETAQYLSVDPLVGISRSAYEYVDGNPLNRVDPQGLCGTLPSGAQGPWIECPFGPLTPAEAGQAEEPFSYYYNQAQATLNGSVGPYGAREVCVYASQLQSQALAASRQAQQLSQLRAEQQLAIDAYTGSYISNPAQVGYGLAGAGAIVGGSETAAAGAEGAAEIGGAYAAGEIGGVAFVGGTIATGGLVIVGGAVIAGGIWLFSHI